MLKEDIPYPVWRVARKFHSATAVARGLPTFLIIGAHKGGTTSLFRYLAQHPDVLPPKEKELRFFTRCYDRGLTWYRSFFPTRVRLSLGRRRRHTFEASTDYLWDSHAPRRIASDLPEAKFIVLLRDPVVRAHSHYKMKIRDGMEVRPFTKALDDQDRIESLITRRRNDASFFSDEAFHHSYLSRGCYLDQIRRWHAHVSKHRIMIVCSEEFFASPEQVYGEILEFLELEPQAGVRFRAFNAGVDTTMTKEEDGRLRAFFRPLNTVLFEYLQRRFPWPNESAHSDG